MNRLTRTLLASVVMVSALSSSVFAQTAAESLALTRGLEPKLPEFYAGAKDAVRKAVPDPEASEKLLPPFSTVLEKNDKAFFKSYGGLSEAYIYAGNLPKGEALYGPFAKNAAKILGEEDPYPALVAGDFGLYYFHNNDFAKAASLCKESSAILEKHLNTENANNLVTCYLLLSVIADKAGNKDEASQYAVKVVDLVKKIKTNQI